MKDISTSDAISKARAAGRKRSNETASQLFKIGDEILLIGEVAARLGISTKQLWERKRRGLDSWEDYFANKKVKK